MRKTAHVPPPWWLTETRERLVARGTDHLAVYIAMTTGPSSHVSGVAYLPVAEIAHLLCLEVGRVSQIVAEMELDGLIVYDHGRSIVWVIGGIENQLGSQKWRDHPKWLTPTIGYLESLPPSRAIERFLTHYRLTDHLGYRYPMDTVSVGSSHPFLSSPPPIPSSEGTPPARKFPQQDENGLDIREVAA